MIYGLTLATIIANVRPTQFNINVTLGCADFEQVFENKVGPIKNSTAFNAAIDKTGIPKIGLKVSEGSVDYAISITPINAVEIDFTYNIIKGKKLENADVNIAIKWKIIFTPQYWQDHPEVKETERPAFATGWAFDLAGNMGETFKVSLETLITAAIAAGILIAGAAVIGQFGVIYLLKHYKREPI